MVYRKDPRAGYGEFEFNIEWFYQYLDERNEELIVCDCDINGNEISQETMEEREEFLEEQIEKAVWSYIVYKIFRFENSRMKLDYDNVYDCMYDRALDIMREKPCHYQLRNLDDEKDDGNP